MESTCEESVKRGQLLKIMHECIANDNDMDYLLEYRGMNDTDWVDREVMCYVLREDVFHLVDWNKIVHYFMLPDKHYRVNSMLPQMHTITLKLADYDEALHRLIDSMESQFKTELCEWNRHWKLCDVLYWMLRQGKHSLSDQTCERMFDYLVKLLEACDHERMIEMAWMALSQFQFNKFHFQLAKYQASLIKLIIGSLESFSFERRKYRKNLNLICGALKCCENLLDKSTLEEIYNYLLRLTELYQEDDEMITQVFDTLSVFPFKKYCSFQFDNFETSLVKFVDLRENENAKTKENYDKHAKFCGFLKWTLRDFKDSLSQEARERMLDYLVKLIETCDDEDTISCAWDVSKHFPFDKHKSFLFQLLNSIENLQNQDQRELKSHENLCELMKKVLFNCKASLSYKNCKKVMKDIVKLIETCEDKKRIESYWNVLTQLPLDKYQTLLLQLIDLVENKLNNGQLSNIRLCGMLQRLLYNSFNPEAHSRMFNYLMKLIETCDDEKTIESAWDTLRHFPFGKYQTLLLQLIDLVENKFNDGQLMRNRGLCGVMRIMLLKNKNLFNPETYLRLLDYLVKLLETYDDEEMINSAMNVLRRLPFDKHQSSLLQLIDSMKAQLDTQKCVWKAHKCLCEVVGKVLNEFRNSFNTEIYERILDYLVKLLETCDDEKTIFCACGALQRFSLLKVQSFLIQVLNSTMNNLRSSPHNWKIDQNLCRIIDRLTLPRYVRKSGRGSSPKSLHKGRFVITCAKIIDRLQINRVYNRIEQSTLFDRNFMKNLFDYLSKMFAHCNHMATILSSVLLIENLYVKGLWDDEIMKLMTFLKDKLLHGQLYGECYNNEGALPDNVDHFERYQVNWCVRWWMDNLMGRDGVKTKLPLVKLSQDRCEARNDNNRYVEIMEEDDDGECLHPVRSSFSVSCGVYYYEVTVITNGKMMFGWSTRETSFKNKKYDKYFGHDRYSINIDASRKVIWHNSKKIVYSNLPDCLAGDVIGCLIDCDARRFVFYYKGHVMELVGGKNEIDESEDGEVLSEYVKMSVSKRILFSLSPYFATATLSLHQQCHFNFGQSPFKFVPKDITFRHFHEASGGDGRKYQLNRTFMLYDQMGYLNHWFEHSPVDNQVDLFYCDKIQKIYDDEVKKVGTNIQSNRDIGKWRLETYEIAERSEYVRYIQSIIEMMDKVIGNDKVDVVAMWIGNVVFYLFYSASKPKLLELLYPYLQLRINSSSQDSTKHRYICIVLSHLIQYSESVDYDFIKHIRSEVFTYLTRTLTETNDEWTKLFVLIAIDNLKLNHVEINATRTNSKLNHLLKIDYHQENVLQILKPTNKFVDYQVYLCAQLYNERTFSTTHSQVDLSTLFDELIWETSLNASEQKEELKLSRDRLSARSDWGWQSVRSLSCDIDYYEVLLFTSGPMRIGWATKRTNLYRTEIGDDQFSIALDGYHQCVWYNEDEFPVRNMSNRWRAGDIVGCRFDKKHGAFYFTLNGHSIAFECEIYNSSQPYYVAASLYTHQQCYFNLGQLKFNYKLKSSKEAFISNSSLTNSIINVNSTPTIGDVSFSAQQSMISLNIPNEMSQILPTFENFYKQGYSDHNDRAIIICQQCNKKVCFKKLKTDCGEHFSMLFKFENIQSPSIVNSPQTLKALSSNSKQIVNDCHFCCKVIETRPLQFVGCDHGKVCSDCVSVMLDCPKCKRMATNVQPVNQSSSIECQHCDQQIQTRPLQFVDCVHGKMCRDCVSYIFDCPKCRRLGK